MIMYRAKQSWETSHLFLEWGCEDFEQTLKVNWQTVFVSEVFKEHSRFSLCFSEVLVFGTEMVHR